ncbi:hypothetical protein ACHAW6_002052 [Cyclotella cf. meneghiniana]
MPPSFMGEISELNQEHMAMAAAISTLNLQQQLLTTEQFCSALIRHVDESKPDPLVKNQIMNLRLNWEQTTQRNIGANAATGVIGEILREGNLEKINKDCWMMSSIICGTLHIASEYISAAIHVKCKWRIKVDEYSDDKSSASASAQDIGQNDTEFDVSIKRPSFQDELYFRLGVSVSFNSLTDYNKNICQTATSSCTEQKEKTISQKIERNEMATNRKLRVGMIKRLQSDPLIRRLLVDDDNSSLFADEGVLLCEALIQQNQKRSTLNDHEETGGTVECEERVNVDSESVEGIRNAIMTHCEENLDVLELFLNMPYLPRGNFFQCGDECKDSPTRDETLSHEKNALKSLAERAFLRILEDAMWDACEKEGEDEMLDDLVICEDYECECNSDGLELLVTKKQRC